MRATGIVRRIDELGRVVIPKEIRRTQRIKSGDSLEIFTDKNGEVVFKKYSPLAELGEPAALYADVLARRLQCAVLVCDRERVVAAAGAGRTGLQGLALPPAVEALLARQPGRRGRGAAPTYIIGKVLHGIVTKLLNLQKIRKNS